jgi:hypothetical protein
MFELHVFGTSQKAIIDLDEMEYASCVCWELKDGKIISQVSRKELKNFIMSGFQNHEIGNISGDEFDCRKANLRPIIKARFNFKPMIKKEVRKSYYE